METYRPRVADQELAAWMATMGAVLIEGPKACGKTMTAQRLAATSFYFDEDPNAREAVDLDPESLFAGPAPILFDEWQLAPAIWNRVRRQVDARQARGLVLLTGSATPRDDDARHSGAGRIGVLTMRPMSLWESGHSTGSVSLAALFDGAAPSGRDAGLTVPDLVRRIVIGGWPGLLDADETDAHRWLAGYVRNAVEVDVPALGARRDPRNLRRLLAALARGVGQPVKVTALAADVGGERGPVATSAIYAYLDALKRLMLLDNSEAWLPHMRSRLRLRTSPVRYFVDPSLAPAALEIGSADLLADLSATGYHFEALAIRDLRIYAQALGGAVRTWRDESGHEIDAVVTLPGGRWGAFEVKLNPRAADEAAASLLRFAAKVDASKVGPPAVLAVITSTGFAGRRPDGVAVLPLTTLAP